MAEVQVRGTVLSYGAHGPLSGEPVLLLPPAATRGAVWRRHQVPALTAAGYRVITCDLRERPPAGLAELVADAAGLITALDLGPCRIVGASLGGMIAQELALARPELVRALCLLGGRGQVDDYREALGRGFAQTMRHSHPGTALFEATAAMSLLFGPETLADNEFVTGWLETYRLFRPGGPGAAAHYQATTGYHRLAALGRITAPALVLSFGLDQIMPPAHGRAVAAAIPGAAHVELPGCGHFGFLERPAEVNELITRFLAGGRP